MTWKHPAPLWVLWLFCFDVVLVLTTLRPCVACHESKPCEMQLFTKIGQSLTCLHHAPRRSEPTPTSGLPWTTTWHFDGHRLERKAAIQQAVHDDPEGPNIHLQGPIFGRDSCQGSSTQIPCLRQEQPLRPSSHSSCQKSLEPKRSSFTQVRDQSCPRRNHAHACC